MKYLNASQSAKRIGISDRTIRRWLKPDKYGKVKLASTRTESGQLAIAEADVERLRQEVEEERTRFVTSTHGYAMTRTETPTHDIGHGIGHGIDTDTLFTRIAQRENQPEISVLTRELGKLQAKVDVQDAKIAELERRITELEARNTPTQPQAPLHRFIVDREEDASLPQIRVSTSPTPPTDIPHDSLMMADFAQLHKVPRATFLRHCTQGLRNDPPVETIERPKPGREKYNEKERWLSPEQQEAALHFWVRQKVKYYLCDNPECACNLL